MTADRDIVFVPIGINYDHVLEDSTLIAMADESYSKGTWRHTRDVLRFIGSNLFASAEAKLSRYGYASVNFGVPLSARDYCERTGQEFRRLEKEFRFQHVEKLAEQLLEAIRHVMPILPVPLVATVLEEHETLSAGEVVEKVNESIERLIDSGSAMKLDDKPKESTIRLALGLLTERDILRVEDNRFRINEDSKNLVQYYANSIRQ